MLELLGKFDPNQGAVRAVRFNSDGNYALVAGSDKTVTLYNVQRRSLLKRYLGHGSEVLDVTSSNDNSTICSCGNDKCVTLLDVTSAQQLRKFRGHAGAVSCVRFNTDGTLVFSGSIDCSVRVWDCKARQSTPILQLDDATDAITAIMVTASNIVVASADGHLRNYDIRRGSLCIDYVGKPITGLALTGDMCPVVASSDSTVRLFDHSNGELLNEYTGHRLVDYKIECAITSDEKMVVCGSEDSNLFVWDLMEANVVQRLAHRGSVVHSVSAHPKADHRILLSAANTVVYVWGEISTVPEAPAS